MQDMTTALIIGQGEVNYPQLHAFAPQLPLIALDGAAHMLQLNGLSADVIIGDFDSFDKMSFSTSDAAQFKIDEQDSNDFEKALYHLKPQNLVGFGLFGKRFDQAMANLHVMAKYHDVTKIIAVTNDEIITVHKGHVNLLAIPGALVAIIPLAPIRFAASHGLAYGLDALSLGIGQLVSSSNQALGSMIEVIPLADDAHVYYACCRPLALLKHDEKGLEALFA